MKQLKIWLNREHTAFRLLTPVIRPMEWSRKTRDFVPLSWFKWADDVAQDLEPNNYGLQLSDA